MAYDGTSIKDLDVLTPTEGSSVIPELNDSLREIKTVIKNQFAEKSITYTDSPYTVLESDYIIFVNANDGNVTVNLPAASDASSTTFVKEYIIVKTDSSTNTVTVDGYGSELIGASLTVALSSIYEGIHILGNGSGWINVANPKAISASKIYVSSNDTTAGYLNGKLVAGDNITFTEGTDGGNETLTIESVQLPRDQYRALTISATSDTAISVSGTDVVLQNTSGNSMMVASVSETINTGTSGINGLDTGSMAAQTWYFIWVIAKADGTVDCLISTSATSPTMPTGYTFKALIGSFRTDSGDTHILKFYQKNNRVELYTERLAVDDGTAYAHAAVLLTAYVPSTATKVRGYAVLTYSSANRTLEMAGWDGSVQVGIYKVCTSHDASERAAFDLTLITQNISYALSASGGCTVDINISGWEY